MTRRESLAVAAATAVMARTLGAASTLHGQPLSLKAFNAV